MYDYLLEIFCEEIPARLQKFGAENLKKYVTQMFSEHGLAFTNVNIYWTPCRLCLDIRGLASKAQDKIIVKKGPRIDAPHTAIAGFLQNCGLSHINQAQIIEDPKKGNYYVANIVQEGGSVFEIINKYMAQTLQLISWPKSMRWGPHSVEATSLAWIRPIKNIMSILYSEIEGTQLAPFSFADIKANNYSYGHSFLSDNKTLVIKNFEDYIQQLSKNYVILDPLRRKNLIKNDIENLVFANGLEIVPDEELLDEIVNLVEYPVILLGSFDENFLALPSRIIQTTIRENQKNFVTRKINSPNLANKFIICANIVASDGGALIIKGNERVVDARLKDALYFYNKDREHELAYFMEQLKPQYINAYPQLGTQGDKLKRILELSLFIGKQFDYDNKQNIERAVALAKADLSTEMVKEFPNLQGYIGKEYALKQGESDEVASAIEGHYKPQNFYDKAPKDSLSIILGLADKIDILTGFWSVGEKPNGSRDPFALRRTALGLIRLVLAQEHYLDLKPLLGQAIGNFGALDKLESLLDFINERFKHYLKEEGARYDAIEAVMQITNSDLLYQARMIEALISYLDSANGLKFVQAIKRASNILTASQCVKNFEVKLETSPYAIDLYNMAEQISTALPISGKKDFADLNKLTPYIENFFEYVMVNDKNEAIKQNRICLLHYVERLAQKFADFSKIVVNT